MNKEAIHARMAAEREAREVQERNSFSLKPAILYALFLFAVWAVVMILFP